MSDYLPVKSAALTHQKTIQNVLCVLLILGALLIFIPNYFVYHWAMRFAVQIMWFYLLLGFLFLFVSQQRLVFVSFGCCAALCLFLKNASNNALIFSDKATGMPTFKVAHFNLTSMDASFQKSIRAMLEVDATVVSLQELTPFLSDTIAAAFKEKYPYSIVLPRLDLYGTALYSKIPFSKTDTLFYRNIPTVIGQLGREKIDGDEQQEGNQLVVVSVHTEPPLSSNAYRRLKEHLTNVAAKLENVRNPIFLVGDLNVVPWSNEVQDFRLMTGLQDSRRGYMPTYPKNAFSMFSLPIDHILYSEQFKCVDFKTLSTATSDHLGIEATFQLDEKANYHGAAPPQGSNF